MEVIWSKIVQTGTLLFRPFGEYGFECKIGRELVKYWSRKCREWVKTVSDWPSNSSYYFQWQIWICNKLF